MSRQFAAPADLGCIEPGSRGTGASDQGYLSVLPSGSIHALDPVAWIIWSCAADLGDEAAVIAQVAELTDSASEAIAPDVAAFLDELVSLGLLVVGPRRQV